MTDRSSTMTTDQRVAIALERIEDVLVTLLERVPSPPRARTTEEVPEPAHEAYLSGQWHRRSGNIIPTPAPGDLQSRPGRLDPWVRIDVPAIDGEPDLGQAATNTVDS